MKSSDFIHGAECAGRNNHEVAMSTVQCPGSCTVSRSHKLHLVKLPHGTNETNNANGMEIDIHINIITSIDNANDDDNDNDNNKDFIKRKSSFQF